MSEILDLSHVTLSGKPLIVCDVDDVVLQFTTPFQQFLLGQGHELLPRSFRLTGNIVAVDTQLAVDAVGVRGLIEAFFEAQEAHQVPFDLVAQTLCDLAGEADIAFLTAMPPRYQDQRRRLLDRLNLPFPLIASEEAKGPVMQRLRGETSLPCVFIDDMVHNLQSVRDNVPDCLLIHMMPDSPLHLLAPKPSGEVVRAMDWKHAAELIRAHIKQ